MNVRRTTKEPRLSPASALAPIVAQLQAMIAGMASAPLIADDLDAKAFTDGRRDGLQSAITLLVRASATTITNDDGQRLVKLEREMLDKRIPPDVVALLDKRIDDLTARVRALEELSPSTKPKAKAMPAILATPNDERPGKCARALLLVLASRSGSPTSTAQLARLSKYSSTSSSFTHAIGWLRRSSWVSGPTTDLRVTTTGMQNAPKVQPAPTSGSALVDYWCAVLSKGERAMLRAISAHGALSIQRLATETGYSPTSSSFTHAIGTLRKLGLVEPGWPAQACAAIANNRQGERR